jgi:Raf kinase inhibitor-like YbhB/YbcL family protein
MALTISSPAFGPQQPISRTYAADGEDRSPPLSWSGAPEKTKCLALVVDDLDAPAGQFVNWVAFNIPATERGLTEDVPHQGDLSDGMLQGRNSLDRIGYTGPCPNKGETHRYLFSLFALDARLELDAGASKADVERAMKGHVLEGAQFVAEYRRSQ